MGPAPGSRHATESRGISPGAARVLGCEAHLRFGVREGMADVLRAAGPRGGPAGPGRAGDLALDAGVLQQDYAERPSEGALCAGLEAPPALAFRMARRREFLGNRKRLSLRAQG